jgi:hypothetical protein
LKKKRQYQEPRERRDTIAGCDANDPMARALAIAIVMVAKDEQWVCDRFGTPCISWQPEYGGWRVYSLEWSLGFDLPERIRKLALEIYSRETGNSDGTIAIRKILRQSLEAPHYQAAS